MPLYVAFHLVTSPTANAPSAANVNAPLVQLKALSLSVIIGYIVPSLFLVFPETWAGYLPSKQERIAFWQAWPVYVWMAQSSICKFVNLVHTDPGPDSTVKARNARTSLRYVYAFAYTCAATTHISSAAISLGAWAVPGLFNPELVSALQPAQVFQPVLPWSSARPESLATGALWFLQWDHLIGAGAVLLWSISLYLTAHSARKINVSVPTLVMKVVTVSAASGLAGAAVELMWERDELLLGSESESQQVKRE